MERGEVDGMLSDAPWGLHRSHAEALGRSCNLRNHLRDEACRSNCGPNDGSPVLRWRLLYCFRASLTRVIICAHVAQNAGRSAFLPNESSHETENVQKKGESGWDKRDGTEPCRAWGLE